MAIVYTTITIDGVEYDYTYSDADRYIVRDGARYASAIDPLNANRLYEEGDQMPQEEIEETAKYILDILLGDEE